VDITSGIELNVDGGNDAYLIASDGGAVLGGLGEFTVETTFSTTNKSGNAVLLSYAAGEANGNDLLVYLNGSTLHFYIDGLGSAHSGMDYSQLADGKQHSLAISWDNTNGNYAIYVDGELIESGTGKAVGSTLLGSAGTGAQHKFASGSLPTGLLANWQMDGFNGSNQVVDVVSGNNLSIGNVATAVDAWSNQQGGVTASGNTLTFSDDSAPNGWNSQINSATFSSLGFTDDYTVSFTLDNTTNFAFMIGLGVTDAGAGQALLRLCTISAMLRAISFHFISMARHSSINIMA